jgi:hypothetical protein
MAALFDAYYANVPRLVDEIADSTIFIDEAHLSDLGNRIVAENLIRMIFPARISPR